MNDRPLTLVLIAVAILAALYLRRKRVHTSSDAPGQRQNALKDLMTTEQMVQEGLKRGVWWDPKTQPMTREQFERAMGPVSVK